MSFAQKLVDADRASLFLVDNKSSEVYARIFNGASETTPEEIRFPIGTGIAGQVALTGEVKYHRTQFYKVEWELLSFSFRF